MARLNRASLRRGFLALCRRAGMDDDERHALVLSVTGGRTQSVAEPERGHKDEVASVQEIMDAIRWLHEHFPAECGASRPASAPRPTAGPGSADWIDIPHCPTRPGGVSAGTVRKILAIARDAFGEHWRERLDGMVFGEYPKNPIPVFPRRRAAECDERLGHRLAALPASEATKALRMVMGIAAREKRQRQEAQA